MYAQERRGHLWILIGWLVFAGVGCTHLIFEPLRQQAQPPVSYAQRRRITVAGQVLGTYTGKVGEVDYLYPLISCEETHLFPTASAELRRYAAHPWWYGDPFFYPWRMGPYPYAFWGPYWRY